MRDEVFDLLLITLESTSNNESQDFPLVIGQPVVFDDAQQFEPCGPQLPKIHFGERLTARLRPLLSLSIGIRVAWLS
jgi:hypothetical protein